MPRTAAILGLLLVCLLVGGAEERARGDGPRPGGWRAGFTVVLDAGHGGSNLGAPAVVPGVFEKKVTLVLARMVRRRLEEDGVKVVSTREADAYLTLGQRVRRANGAAADLFVSLHANAAPDHQRRGFFAYVLSREVSDIEARKASGGSADPTEAMVARARVRSLALRSAQLAATLRAELGKARPGGDHGTRQAPFDVLEGLQMPGALLEVGFLDHEEEGRELLDPEVLHKIADAVADGVEAFGRGAIPEAAALPVAAPPSSSSSGPTPAPSTSSPTTDPSASDSPAEAPGRQ